jgi:hypothetical protein
VLIDKVSKRIITWNKENVWDLKEWLDIYHYNQKAYECLTGQIHAIDMEYLIYFLPSETISYRMIDRSVGRIWAMDKNGMCLVGENFDMICSLDDLKIKR